MSESELLKTTLLSDGSQMTKAKQFFRQLHKFKILSPGLPVHVRLLVEGNVGDILGVGHHVIRLVVLLILLILLAIMILIPGLSEAGVLRLLALLQPDQLAAPVHNLDAADKLWGGVN